MFFATAAAGRDEDDDDYDDHDYTDVDDDDNDDDDDDEEEEEEEEDDDEEEKEDLNMQHVISTPPMLPEKHNGWPMRYFQPLTWVINGVTLVKLVYLTIDELVPGLALRAVVGVTHTWSGSKHHVCFSLEQSSPIFGALDLSVWSFAYCIYLFIYEFMYSLLCLFFFFIMFFQYAFLQALSNFHVDGTIIFVVVVGVAV